MAGLVKEAFEHEGSAARKIALDAIQLDKDDSTRMRRVFNFNMFDVEIDYLASRVTIKEVCSPCREQVVPLAEFVEILRYA